jgi:hypothetical protein
MATHLPVSSMNGDMSNCVEDDGDDMAAGVQPDTISATNNPEDDSVGATSVHLGAIFVTNGA